MFSGNFSANNENDISKLLSTHFKPSTVTSASGDLFHFNESNIDVLIYNDDCLVISKEEILPSIKELSDHQTRSIGSDRILGSF